MSAPTEANRPGPNTVWETLREKIPKLTVGEQATVYSQSPKLKRSLRTGLAFLLIVSIVGSLLNESKNLLYYLAQAGAGAVIRCFVMISLGVVSAWSPGLSLPIRITIERRV